MYYLTKLYNCFDIATNNKQDEQSEIPQEVLKLREQIQHEKEKSLHIDQEIKDIQEQILIEK